MKGVRPQRMSSKEFDAIAVAVEDRMAPGRWSVYVGHDVVGTCEAEDEQQAVARVHREAVLGSLPMAAGATKVTGDECSAAAICSYPDILKEFPEVACAAVNLERGPLGRLTVERRAISDLLCILDWLSEAGCVQSDRTQWLAAKAIMEAARRTLTEVPSECREASLEGCLRALLDARDTKAADDDRLWELARSFVEAGGRATYGTWAAAVYVMCAEDVLESSTWKAMFDAGMTPGEAVMHRGTTGSTNKH